MRASFVVFKEHFNYYHRMQLICPYRKDTLHLTSWRGDNFSSLQDIYEDTAEAVYSFTKRNVHDTHEGWLPAATDLSTVKSSLYTLVGKQSSELQVDNFQKMNIFPIKREYYVHNTTKNSKDTSSQKIVPEDISSSCKLMLSLNILWKVSFKKKKKKKNTAPIKEQTRKVTVESFKNHSAFWTFPSELLFRSAPHAGV